MQICPEGHRKSFCTQETIGRSHTGDIWVVSAILLSGNNYEKINLLARFAKLNMMLSATYSKIQAHYIIPAIEEHWRKTHAETIERHCNSHDDMVHWEASEYKTFLLYWGIPILRRSQEIILYPGNYWQEPYL